MKTSCGLFCVAFCLFLNAPESKADSFCSSLTGNLVNNCGFQTGDFTGWTLKGNDVPGLLGNLYGVEGVDPLDGISPHSGVTQAYIADLDSNATTLSQTLATAAGQAYMVTLYLAQDTALVAPYSNEFSVSFGGVVLDSLTAVPVEGYTEYSFSASATGASSMLSITLGNDLGEFLLDDVSVVATPEPAAYALLATAVAMAAFARRRRQRVPPTDSIRPSQLST